MCRSALNVISVTSAPAPWLIASRSAPLRSAPFPLRSPAVYATPLSGMLHKEVGVTSLVGPIKRKRNKLPAHSLSIHVVIYSGIARFPLYSTAFFLYLFTGIRYCHLLGQKCLAGCLQVPGRNHFLLMCPSRTRPVAVRRNSTNSYTLLYLLTFFALLYLLYAKNR